MSNQTRRKLTTVRAAFLKIILFSIFLVAVGPMSLKAQQNEEPPKSFRELVPNQIPCNLLPGMNVNGNTSPDALEYPIALREYNTAQEAWRFNGTLKYYFVRITDARGMDSDLEFENKQHLEAQITGALAYYFSIPRSQRDPKDPRIQLAQAQKWLAYKVTKNVRKLSQEELGSLEGVPNEEDLKPSANSPYFSIIEAKYKRGEPGERINWMSSELCTLSWLHSCGITDFEQGECDPDRKYAWIHKFENDAKELHRSELLHDTFVFGAEFLPGGGIAVKANECMGSGDYLCWAQFGIHAASDIGMTLTGVKALRTTGKVILAGVIATRAGETTYHLANRDGWKAAASAADGLLLFGFGRWILKKPPSEKSFFGNPFSSKRPVALNTINTPPNVASSTGRSSAAYGRVLADYIKKNFRIVQKYSLGAEGARQFFEDIRNGVAPVSPELTQFWKEADPRLINALETGLASEGFRQAENSPTVILKISPLKLDGLTDPIALRTDPWPGTGPSGEPQYRNAILIQIWGHTAGEHVRIEGPYDSTIRIAIGEYHKGKWKSEDPLGVRKVYEFFIRSVSEAELVKLKGTLTERIATQLVYTDKLGSRINGSLASAADYRDKRLEDFKAILAEHLKVPISDLKDDDEVYAAAAWISHKTHLTMLELQFPDWIGM